jgi:hypothetical protein
VLLAWKCIEIIFLKKNIFDSISKRSEKKKIEVKKKNNFFKNAFEIQKQMNS